MKRVRLLSLLVCQFVFLALMISWQPTRAGAQPAANGFKVETYCVLSQPASLSFSPSGVLYAGNNNDRSTIYKIKRAGAQPKSYGDTPLFDPDAIGYDTSGSVSGRPGSVLVGGVDGPGSPTGYLAAIFPDQRTVTVFGPESGLINPTDLLFDQSGRLLIADTFAGKVFSSDDGVMLRTLIDDVYLAGELALDRSGNLFVAQHTGPISKYAADGTLLDGAFVTGLDIHGMDFGPRSMPWEGHLFAISYEGVLYRIDEKGVVTEMGSGFHTPPGDPDLQFGPDGALYISGNDAIYRVTPYRITIEAEDYIDYFDTTRGNAGGQYRDDDVDIWSLYPGINYVGATNTGEWLEYPVDSDYGYMHFIDIKVATPLDDRILHVEVDGKNITGPRAVPNTGGWTNWQTLRLELWADLVGGHVVRVVFESGGVNFEQFEITPSINVNHYVADPKITPNGGLFNDSVDVSLSTVTPGATIYYTTDGSNPRYSDTRLMYSAPFPVREDTKVRAYAFKAGSIGEPDASAVFKISSWSQTIQAEDYTGYFDKTAGNAGGKYRGDNVDIWSLYPDVFYVGSTGSGEWLEYAIDLPLDGWYRIGIRLATPNSGRTAHLDVDGEDKTGPINVPNTGDWRKWRTVKTDAALSSGRQTLRLAFDAGGMNIDQMTLQYIGEGKVWFGDCEIFDTEDVSRLAGYSEVTGSLTIDWTSASDFSELSGLVRVGGNLVISANHELASLNGLENLVFVGGDLTIAINNNLPSLLGLHELTHIGGQLIIHSNSTLESLQGLNNLSYAGELIWIFSNENLVSLEGLEGLTKTVEVRLSGPNLRSLHGLRNLVSVLNSLEIGGTNELSNLAGLERLTDVGRLWIGNNYGLTDLGGLNLSAVHGNLEIVDNPNVTSLEALRGLTSLEGDLVVTANDSLVNLNGLDNLVDIGALLIADNENLTDLNLNSLNRVEGNLRICRNPVLPQAQVQLLIDQLRNGGGIGGKIDIGQWCY